ncbi:Nn.00g033210.m01.CDS01 [Neocucurbitaria sp. VM-36]
MGTSKLEVTREQESLAQRGGDAANGPLFYRWPRLGALGKGQVKVNGEQSRKLSSVQSLVTSTANYQHGMAKSSNSSLREYNANNTAARPPRRPQHARGSNSSLRLLYRLDTVHGTTTFSSYAILTTFMHLPFVDDDHILHSFFLPRVWAIRIPVILIILGTTVVGSFLSVVMIRSNRKKALKAKQKKAS